MKIPSSQGNFNGFVERIKEEREKRNEISERKFGIEDELGDKFSFSFFLMYSNRM
jgi:hypothetical protein